MSRIPLLSLALIVSSLLGACRSEQAATAADEQAAAAPLPAPPAWLKPLDAMYDTQLRVAGLEDRAFAPERWWEIAGPLAAPSLGFRTATIGRSVESRPLRHIVWGQGGKRVLLWSQMHGDESTATMAFADLFRFLGAHPDDPLVQRLRRDTTLHFFPLVNPDGAARFIRNNAQGIDINRDARRRSTPEARALHALRGQVRPQFAFNLHDQRVGYRAGDSERGVAMALLAPPFNAAREVDATRGRAIEIAVAMRAVLEPYIGGHIARWDDTFNPRAFGDLTAKSGASTVLVEAGGLENDPHKQRLRKLYFLALVAGLDAIATGAHVGMPRARYEELPENGKVWADLRIDGATLALPDQPTARADVLVNFQQPLLERGGTIAEIGDLDATPARRTIDATGLYIVPIRRGDAKPRPVAPFTPAHFHLSRDPRGEDVVWTLAGDVDPAMRDPATAR